jgi:hypothetical protein
MEDDDGGDFGVPQAIVWFRPVVGSPAFRMRVYLSLSEYGLNMLPDD